MTERNFWEMIQQRYAQEAYVCVGLDFDHAKMPTQELINLTPFEAICRFMCEVVDQTKLYASCYKPNFWFYFGYGSKGIKGLERIIKYIKTTAPDIPVILDFKGGDIGNTVKMMAKGAVEDNLEVDAVTVHPHMGISTNLKPLYQDPNKFTFIILRTSNDEGSDNQRFMGRDRRMYYQKLADDIEDLNQPNVGAVFGATFPGELAQFRKAHPGMKLLIPGIGTQGGDLIETISAAQDDFIINSSSGITYKRSEKSIYPQYIQQNVIVLNNSILDVVDALK